MQLNQMQIAAVPSASYTLGKLEIHTDIPSEFRAFARSVIDHGENLINRNNDQLFIRRVGSLFAVFLTTQATRIVDNRQESYVLMITTVINRTSDLDDFVQNILTCLFEADIINVNRLTLMVFKTMLQNKLDAMLGSSDEPADFVAAVATLAGVVAMVALTVVIIRKLTA
jgi:hypothetical protein